MRDGRSFNSTLRPRSLKRAAQPASDRKPRTPLAKVNVKRAEAAHLRNFGEEHGDFVRSHPCIAAGAGGCVGRIEAAHSSHRGMGGCKGDKTDLFPACWHHHNEVDGRRPLPDGAGVGMKAFSEYYGVDPFALAARLWAESPENPEQKDGDQ